AVTITGTSFVAGATVTIGGVLAASVTLVNATTINATTGAHAEGPADVVVTNPNTLTGTLASGFNYLVLPPAPTISSILPLTGTSLGGTPVTINGTGFTNGATVSIGGVAAANAAVVNATRITATTRAHTVATVDV